MRSYDEITANVLEATRQHRRKVKRIQYTASVSAMCLTCTLGLGVYMNLEKPEAILPSTEETSTETVQKATNAVTLPSDTSTELQYQLTEFSDNLFLPNMGGNVSDSLFATATVPSETDPIETEAPTETQTSVVQTSVVSETTNVPQSTDTPETSKTTSKNTSSIATTHHPFTTETAATAVPLTTNIPFTTTVCMTTEGIFSTRTDGTENPTAEPTAPSESTESGVSSETTLCFSLVTDAVETTTTTTTTVTENIPTDTDNTLPPESLPPQNLPPNSILSPGFTDFLLANLTEEELEQFRQFIESGDLISALDYLTETLPLLPIS